jgi:hypothetical protein
VNEKVTKVTVKGWLDEGVSSDEMHRRIAAARITADQIKAWFEDALAKDDRKPSRAAYEQLAKEISQLREVGWPDSLKEAQAKRYAAVMRAAEELHAAINHWAEIASVELPAPHFPQIAEALAEMGVRAISRAPPKPPRGQPRAEWHRYGRKYAEMVKAALIEADYQGRTKPTDPESATAYTSPPKD